jgi:hypothetical protein
MHIPPRLSLGLSFEPCRVTESDSRIPRCRFYPAMGPSSTKTESRTVAENISRPYPRRAGSALPMTFKLVFSTPVRSANALISA